jgi:hypothetical protein
VRDDFPNAVLETLAKRVGYRCSNPACRKLTSGPHTDETKALNVGVGAHITAASPGGPRYDPSLSAEQRRSADNGIWLCQTCGKLVDNDEVRYPKKLLVEWKQQAEQDALREIESASSTSKAAPSDTDALKEYGAHFDRAALHDSLRSCGSYKKFAESLGDLISLLNTGAVQGKALTKRRADFDKIEWRAALEALFHEIRELRGLYTSLVKSGEIDEDKCTCGFRNNSMYHVFDMKKQAIIDELNTLLIEAKLPRMRGVLS